MMLVNSLGRQSELLEFASSCSVNGFGGTEALQKFGSGARSDAGRHIEFDPIANHVRNFLVKELILPSIRWRRRVGIEPT